MRSTLLPLLLLLGAVAIASADNLPATPSGTIPIGDSPFALALASGNTQAVVVNLFPVQSDGSNVRVLDLNAKSQLRAFRAGTRLVAIAVTGTTALVVNEDQDVIRVIDVNLGREVAQIPVGSRPSNVIVSGPNTAVATNGTSGDLSFIDISGRRVVGSPLSVGTDPRAMAVHPGGRYSYVALGGENSLAVLDLGVTPQKVLTKVPVGKNPVAVVVTPDGRRAVVANLTNNTVTVLDLSNPASPQVVMNVPVGVQPTALAVNPQKQNEAYVANLGSQFFSVLDISKDQRSALTGVVQMNTQSSGIQVSSDGKNLFVTEFKNSANLRIYDLANMPLDPKPAIDIPGEPRFKTFLRSTGDCASSFYITEATLVAGQKEGFWGMEVLVSQGELTGGFNLGGGFEGNAQLPGFGAFSLATAQQVTATVNAQQLPGTTGTVGLDVALKSGGNRVAGTSGAPPLTFNANLQPGFYVIEIKSLANAPRGTFQMGLAAQSFSGGVVVGGFIKDGLTGFGAFCVPQSQNVDMRLVGNSEYGSAAAGDLILTLKDTQRNVIRSINNAISASAPVTPPAAPPVPTNIRWYVDASVTASGSGSSTSPLKSITEAFSKAQPGEVIFVRKGRYSPSRTGERLPMDQVKASVQVVGESAATTIIDGENQNANAVVIASNNVRFAGFTVRGAGQVGVFVYGTTGVIIENNLFTSNTRFGVGSGGPVGQPGARGLIVRNNVAVSNLESGIALGGATGLAISNAPTNCPSSPAGNYGAWVINNTANDNRADGILLSQGGNVCVANNVTSNNGSSGIEFNNRAEGTTNPPLNGVIVNNEITNNGGVQFGFAGTGILITEGGRGDIIQTNKLLNNRPFGIGIFLNGQAGVIGQNTITDTPQQGILVQRGSQADEISNNTVRNNGLSGLFVENNASVARITGNVSTGNGTGLSILDKSSVTTVDQNTLDNNAVGMEIAGASRASVVSNTTFDSNNDGGVYVRETSTLSGFSNNKVRNNRGQGGLLISASTATLSGSEVSSNLAAGVNLFLGATVTIQNCQINLNQAEGGIFLNGSSKATISGTTINGNVKQGILAAEAGTTATLSGGNSITNTLKDASGSGGFGLNAQNGGSITCSGTNTLSGNAAGNVFGAVTGCQ